MDTPTSTITYSHRRSNCKLITNAPVKKKPATANLTQGVRIPQFNLNAHVYNYNNSSEDSN